MAEIIKMPKLGFDMAEGILVRWVKTEGETISKGEVIAEIETDKATVEVESDYTGTLHKHLVHENSSVPVGTPIAVVGEVDEVIDEEALDTAIQEADVAEKEPTQVPIESPPPSVATVSEVGERLPEGLRASPVARRIARERGINLLTITGSGPMGRIVKADVEAASVGGPAIGIDPMYPAETQRVPLSKLRGAIGRRMTKAKQEVPHFYLTAELDADPLMSIREDLNSRRTEEDKLSVNDFIVKAAALSLRAFPNLNASFDGDEIIRHGEINIGVAVAVEGGLLTIVARNADQKPIGQISTELKEAFLRAREGKVRPEDVEGSTFTVSNLGMYDIDHFIAIVNPPNAGILAIGSVRKVPVVKDNQVQVGQRFKVTLSADHRVTDGAEGAEWLKVFRSFIEHPVHLLV